MKNKILKSVLGTIFTVAAISPAKTAETEEGVPHRISMEKVTTATDGSSLADGQLVRYNVYLGLHDDEMNDFKATGGPMNWPGMIAWYRPENPMVNGVWADASGLGNHAAAPTAAQRPATGTRNNLPTIVCDGVNDRLEAPSINRDALSKLSGYTVFIVLKHSGAADPSQTPKFNTVVSLGKKIAFQQMANEPHKFYSASGGVQSTKYVHKDNENVTILVERGQAKNGGFIKTLQGYKLYGDNIANTAAIDDNDPNYVFSICGERADANKSAAAEIGEVILYNQNMSQPRANKVATYLAEKWGVNIDYHAGTIFEPDSVALLPQDVLDSCNPKNNCIIRTPQQMFNDCAAMGISDPKKRCLNFTVPPELVGHWSLDAYAYATDLQGRRSAPSQRSNFVP